jgi:hypothetical protein
MKPINVFMQLTEIKVLLGNNASAIYECGNLLSNAGGGGVCPRWKVISAKQVIRYHCKSYEANNR